MPQRLHALHELILTISRRLAWLPPLLARVSVGLVFVSAGWGKLQNLERVTRFFESLGIPAPGFHAPFVGATELVCGALLVLGLATRFAAVPLAITMVVAIRTALWEDFEGATDLLGAVEFAFLVVFAWLAVAGPGAASLDALFARWLRRAASGTGALAP